MDFVELIFTLYAASPRGLLSEERRHTADLQAKMDAAAKAATERENALQAKIMEAAKEASARESKLREQVMALEPFEE